MHFIFKINTTHGALECMLVADNVKWL